MCSACINIRTTCSSSKRFTCLFPTCVFALYTIRIYVALTRARVIRSSRSTSRFFHFIPAISAWNRDFPCQWNASREIPWTTKPFPSLGLMIRRVITIFLYFRMRRNLHGRVSSCLRRTLPLFALRLSRSHVYLPVRHGCVTFQAIRVINRRSYVTQRRIVRYWPWNDPMFMPFNVSIVQDSWCYVLWAMSSWMQANFVYVLFRRFRV